MGIGCGDVTKTSTASIQVEPTELVFPKVAPGEDEIKLPLTITNVGQGQLIISSVTLTEDDDEKQETASKIFCSACGAKLTGGKFCAQCGEKC